MKILFTEEFKRKAEITHYPMIGFWAQFGQKLEGKSWYYQWRLNKSDLYACNTFLYKNENKSRISFTVSNYNDQSNISHYIYLFALDCFQYESITELSSIGDKLFTQLAAVIDLEVAENGNDVINKRVTNIFELPYKPKCSFNCLAATGQIQVEHYNSDYVGKDSFYHEELQDGMFIDKESGLDKLNETLSYSRPSELLGNMTIRKSGIIQL